MERTGIGNVAPSAFTGSAQPYRRQIIGLPLQRSLFGLVPRAATKIGLPGLTSEVDFPAQLDESGDLFLDRAKITAITRELPRWFTLETLERMHMTHTAACDALITASEAASRTVGSFGEPARKSLEDLADKMALVLAYGILSKFVPDVLLRALADEGDLDAPPFPRRSAGAELLGETFGLYQSCCALNYSPQRLQHEWPRVSPEVFQLISEFCNQQTGFGPLAWDSPGYEDPVYVVRLLHSAFDEVDAGEIRRRVSFAKRVAFDLPAAVLPARVAMLRRVLGFWLEFLDRETWYVRRAFYIGMIPILRQFGSPGRQNAGCLELTDLLFLEISELTTGAIDPMVIRTRRDLYLANTEYLSLHGINAKRLATMMRRS